MKTPIPTRVIEKVEPVVEAPVIQEEQDDIAFAGNDRVPALWNITETANGDIDATNSTTGSTFIGTMAQFKACMRG